MAHIADLRFDETTWKAGSELRRSDWKVLVEDLLEQGNFTDAVAGRHLLATVTSESVLFEALDKEGFVKHDVRLALALLAEPLREYAAIICRLDQGASENDGSWFEAMDMAKKVVHDRATSILSRAVGSLSADPRTVRKLFSLLFALVKDTTKTQHARRHRS